MRTKVRVGDLEEWFENPEEELNNFMNSGQAIMVITFANSQRPIELNQRDVGALLIELRRRKSWSCEYCRTINSGKFEECVACGAPRR